jgi:2-polyprenyl-3-methyl-5-hydroxy-6-metoxy-1,4-benzoquinol methylase
MATLDHCLACRSPQMTPFARRGIGSQSFEIRKCRRCGSAFAFPRPTRDEMEGYYRDRAYADQTLERALEVDRSYFPDSSVDALRIMRRCQQLCAGRDLLDIGAGFGFFAKEALALGFRVTAIEPNPNAASGFRQYVGVEPLRAHLSGKIKGELGLDGADVVLLSQVLEHLPDVDQAATAIRDLLRPRGLAAIAVPHFGSVLSLVQGKRDMYLTPPEHLNYFTIRGLTRFFSRWGLTPVYTETVTKVPKERLRRAFGGSRLGWKTVYHILHACDRFRGGMVINAYFRKPGNARDTRA